MPSVPQQPPSRRGSGQADPARSGSSTLAARMRNFANMSKPHVDIRLDGEAQHSYMTTYSTLDKIEGSVVITAPHDTPYDDLDISLVGGMKTYVESMGSVSAVNSRNEAFHQFLHLTQPMSSSSFPTPRTLGVGASQTFPFTFVVPQQLLLSSCRHRTANDKLKDAHLQLPPSMGDPDLAGNGTTLLDDLCPDMVRITYAIRVRLIRYRPRDGGERREQTIADRTRKVRIIPAVEEQPPVNIGDGCDHEYCQRKEKAIRKGVFKAKTGRLAMETDQPQSLRLKHARSTSECPVTTMAKVLLRFDPQDAAATPPRLGSLSTKLKVATFHASSPRQQFPSKSAAAFDPAQGLFVEALQLSTRCMSSVQWHRHESPAEALQTGRRDSAISTDSMGATPKATEAFEPGMPYYTAQLLVPITLPKNKAFVPTFHSCLASRIYVLDMSLAVHGSMGAGVGSSLSLKVPIQVSAEASPEAAGQLDAASPSYDEAMGYSSPDASVTPRTNSTASQLAAAPPPRDEYHTEYAAGHRTANPDQQFEWRGEDDDVDASAYQSPAAVLAAEAAAEDAAPPPASQQLPSYAGHGHTRQQPRRRSGFANFRNSIASLQTLVR